MKDVRVFVHDGRMYQEPYHIWDTNVDGYIADWKETLFPMAKSKNKDHFVYCTKVYDCDDKIIELNIHMTALDEIEFNNRVNAAYEKEAKKGHSIWFGVWHKGTNY